MWLTHRSPSPSIFSNDHDHTENKNAHALSTPHIVGLTVVFFHQSPLTDVPLRIYWNPYWKRFLTWWPWPLAYDLDLQNWTRESPIWSTCQNSSLYVCPFIRESETHTQTDCAKTIPPDTSMTRGVKNIHVFCVVNADFLDNLFCQPKS